MRVYLNARRGGVRVGSVEIKMSSKRGFLNRSGALAAGVGFRGADVRCPSTAAGDGG